MKKRRSFSGELFHPLACWQYSQIPSAKNRSKSQHFFWVNLPMRPVSIKNFSYLFCCSFPIEKGGKKSFLRREPIIGKSQGVFDNIVGFVTKSLFLKN